VSGHPQHPHWPSPAYDALHVEALPSLQDWLRGSSSSSSGSSNIDSDVNIRSVSYSAIGKSGGGSSGGAGKSGAGADVADAATDLGEAASASAASTAAADKSVAFSVAEGAAAAVAPGGDAATVRLALLVNQTAVWGIPAALSSASTGLLHYLEEAAGVGAGAGAGASFRVGVGLCVRVYVYVCVYVFVCVCVNLIPFFVIARKPVWMCHLNMAQQC